jgi:hypothetical protein
LGLFVFCLWSRASFASLARPLDNIDRIPSGIDTDTDTDTGKAHTHTHTHTQYHSLGSSISLTLARALSVSLTLSHALSLSLSLSLTLSLMTYQDTRRLMTITWRQEEGEPRLATGTHRVLVRCAQESKIKEHEVRTK